MDFQPIKQACYKANIYMKHLRKPKGILINFHVQNLFREGQKTYVNEFFAALPDE